MMLQGLSLLVLIALASAAPHQHRPTEALWEMYKEKHSKVYESPSEESRRRSIWEENVLEIMRHNLEADLGKHSYTLAINRFTDQSDKELSRGDKLEDHMNKTLEGSATFLAPHLVLLPEEVDWRKQGYVTPVKDQGSCGSCWAFSTTGSLETHHARKTGNLISLSEQQLVDCSVENGCSGSNMGDALEYVQKAGGIESEEEYPYHDREEKCHVDKSKFVASVRGYMRLTDEESIKQALATVGPVSVGVWVTRKFHAYTHGVYREDDWRDQLGTGHAVVIVGYGEEDGTPYWIVKNSWNTDWGLGGYMKMIRNQMQSAVSMLITVYPLV